MKGSATKEIRDRRKDRRLQTKTRPGWKRLGGLLTILITILGVPPTLLQYQARPTVSLGTPLDPANVMTTPITISNDGMDDLKEVRFLSYFKSITYPHGEAEENIGGRVFDRIDTLSAGEKQEVLPTEVVKITIPGELPTNLDFALVMTFRPAYWPFRKRRFFRFKLAISKDGSRLFRNIASGDIEADFDRALKERGITFE